MTDHESLAGKLLVSPPNLFDPNFNRTVVLMLVHNPDGALGVILNRPSRTRVADLVPLWAPAAAHPAVVHGGGPVEPQAAIALARGDTRITPDGWSPVYDDIGTVDLHRDPDDVGGIQQIRVFVGYSGWGAGQLEDELARGGWIVVAADRNDAFDPDPSTLWERVLLRQASSVALLAKSPDDLGLN